MTYSQELVTQYAPTTSQRMVAHWWPIPYPDFKDLPPILQMQLAQAQAAEERRRMEMVR